MYHKAQAELAKADTGLLVADTAAAALRTVFRNGNPAFIDFGCGTGASMKFAETICNAPGGGVGLDRSAEKVAAADRAGYDAVQADILEFEKRGIAPASFAVDVMPELGGRADFERACVNIVRAARDYTVIQHTNFDSAEALLARGLMVEGHSAKQISIRPRAIDYLHFVMQYGSRLDIVGFAAFGFGEPKTMPAPVTGLSGSLLSLGKAAPMCRSLRIVIARKAPSRFKVALDRAGTGEMLMMWQAPQ